MNDLREQLFEKAKALGFARMYVLRAESIGRMWERGGVPNRIMRFLMHTDPHIEMPGAKSIVLFIWPFAPYCQLASEAEISAYYVHSNAAYRAADELKHWLEERGFEALAHANLPYKALMECANAGQYGRNGVIAVPNYGSFIAIQCILTDAELPVDEADARYDLSDSCKHCAVCVHACPTGALRGDSTVDTGRCLRAQPMDRPIEPSYRPYMTSLLGCDICQTCCPRNAKVRPIDMPQALRNALALPSLLEGNYKPLLPWIGANYARKVRIQARACLVAANKNRSDCTPIFEALSTHADEAVRAHALWAMDKG